MDDLEVLVGSRIFSSVDLIARRERLLPDVYETILAERFARNAYADFKSFSHHVIAGRPLDASHGISAGQAIAQLSRLQRGRAKDGEERGGRDAAGWPGPTR